MADERGGGGALISSVCSRTDDDVDEVLKMKWNDEILWMFNELGLGSIPTPKTDWKFVAG